MTENKKTGIQHIQKLLQETAVIEKNYKLLEQKTGKTFNIFQICDIDKDEVKNCRLIYELLAQKGSHGQGSLYLKLFFDKVLKLPITDLELQKAVVYREYLTAANRRIDLVIETKTMFIPIEVKINAGEQENQCFDYYEEAKRYNKTVKMYYLTKDGSTPSEYSTGELLQDSEARIMTISFAEDILNWLSACLQQTVTIKLAPIREVLLQYMTAIRRFTNQMEDEQSVEIRELLMASPDNMRSAITIQNSLNDAKETLMRNLFQAIEEKVGEKYQKLENEYDYAYKTGEKDAVYGYYAYKNSRKFKKPGISFYYKRDLKYKFDIWVRLEIWNCIYVGYSCAVNNIPTTELPLSYQEFENVVPQSLKEMSLEDSEGYWIYWEYCNNTNNESPDFYNGNDAWFDLFDDKNFEAFANKCANRIITLLEQ